MGDGGGGAVQFIRGVAGLRARMTRRVLLYPGDDGTAGFAALRPFLDCALVLYRRFCFGVI